MNFDVLSFILGKLNCGSDFNDVISYLLGKAVSAVWKTIRNVAVATFTAVASPLKEFVVAVTPIQSGSGDPAPDNVRPISGWDEANIGVSPDLYDATKNTDGYFYNADLEWVANSSVTITDYMVVADVVNIILVSVPNNSINLRVNWFDSGKNILSQTVVATVSETLAYTVTIPSSAAFVRISTNPTLAPFASITSGVIYTVVFSEAAGTVYGGTLSDNENDTWTLTVTHTNIASYAGESINEPWISSMDVFVSGATPTTGAQVVYPLAAPVSYTLTADSVSALIGQNNIFADCGDISVITYREK